MIEHRILERINEEIKGNRSAALATITKIEGSTPRKVGAMMAVMKDGTTHGTVGGGKLELVVSKYAQKCIEEGSSESYKFKLTDEAESLHMQCGGEAEVFIKVFKPKEKLLIVGGGHIALELYELGKILDFHIVVFDDREEYCNSERYPEADELKSGDIGENLKNYSIDEKSYIIIVTRGHKHDEIALRTVIDSRAKYIGMIGSKNKIKHVMNNLLRDGIDQEKLDTLYAPIGINLGGSSPEEIAVSIISEILLVKNEGTLRHMRD